MPTHKSFSILTLSNCELDASLGSGKARLRWIQGLLQRGFQVNALGPSAILKGSSLKIGTRMSLAHASTRIENLNSYDAVECYGAEFGHLCRKLRPLKNRPMLIAHSDGIEAHQELRMRPARRNKKAIHRIKSALASPIHSYLNRTSLTCVDALVAGSVADLDFARSRFSFNEENSRSIPVAIDDAFLEVEYTSAKENIVVFFGSWTERKAPSRIVSTISKVLARRDEARFFVLGASGAKETIMRSFDPALANRIEVFPRLEVPMIIETLRKAKVAFLPSYYEGFGMSTGEAMGCSCVPVLTPTGVACNLKHGVDAFVHDFEDEEGMANSISTLLTDESRRAPMAENAWRTIRDWTWPNQTARLAETYAGWLSRRAESRAIARG